MIYLVWYYVIFILSSFDKKQSTTSLLSTTPFYSTKYPTHITSVHLTSHENTKKETGRRPIIHMKIDKRVGIFRRKKLYLIVIMQTKAYHIYRLHKRSCPLVLGDLASKSRSTNTHSKPIYQ